MLKLTIGHSRKKGEANFGSRGASVTLEIEVESDLISRPEDLKSRIRQLFKLANEEVAEELSGNLVDGHPADANQAPLGNIGIANGNQGYGNGRATSNGNGQNGQRSPRLATASQLRAIRAIAGKHRLDLPTILRQRFNTGSDEQLSISSASQLIDLLKAEAGEVVR